VALWELPQRNIGGLLPEWDDLGAQIAMMRARGAATHLDGARLWEAQTYYQHPFAEIADLFDTVYVSLYKALQGVGGALLAGDQVTIAEAEVWRRRLGGDVFQPWPIALAGLSGLDRLLPRMQSFREHAIAIVAAINADGAARVYPDPPQTPLFHVHLPAPPAAVTRASAELADELGVDLVWRAKSVPDPSRSRFEITVGENAMAFSPEEIVKLIHDLLDRAGRH
jgi:threonine aldolase